jgi:anhydro-N-acetylmuramic acid kinase
MMGVIGLMSGTSLDGVDAAWIETDGERIGSFGPRLTLPYAPDLRDRLRRLLDIAGQIDPASAEIREVTEALTHRHAEAVAAIDRPAALIGMHGQTILHRPEQGRTWQIGDAKLLAALTGTRVAHDFRSADVAAGGQGAPLAPVFHAALAAGLGETVRLPVAVLNIGGVANVTWIDNSRLVAFDTGPGNGPLDDWARQSGLDCDRDGQLSARGRVDPSVLAQLLADPYFVRAAPKSLDRLDFCRRLEASGLSLLSPDDGAATLVAFIVETIALAPLPAPPTTWLVTGGGRHNPTLMRQLRDRLRAPVHPVENVGWDGDALEAQCFGFLAARVAAGLPLSYPDTTGVPHPLVGGVLSSL